MTISNATNKSGPYNENGVTTAFAYGFKIADASHIKVVRAAAGVETVLTLNTHYTVTGVGNAGGGNVVILAPVSGSTLTLVLNVPFTQETDLENQGAYYAEVVEVALDLAAQRDKQLSEEIGRAVKVPVSADATDLDTLIAGVLALSGVADDIAIVAGISGQVVTVAGKATQIETLAGISASIVTVAGIAASVTTVAGMAAQVAAVAAFEDEIIDVAGIVPQIATVAANMTAVNTVATNIAGVSTAATNIAAIIAAPAAAATATTKAAEAAASAASVNAAQISMSRRKNLIVNGSLIDSQENGNTLGATNGYFPADQFGLYFSSATAAMSIQRVQSSKSLAGAANKLEFKTTTAKASLAATDFVLISQPIEGSRPDFVAAGWGAAGAKPFVFRVDQQLPAGLYHIHAQNSAGNRHVAVPFTATGTESVIEVAIPGDTSGTWLTGDGQIGVVIDIVLAAGSSRTGGAASTWGAATYYAASAQANILSSTANVARLADVGLRLDPDATGVYGQYEVGETDAVFRSERYLPVFNYPAIADISVAAVNSTTALRFPLDLRVAPAKSPTGATLAAGSLEAVRQDGAAAFPFTAFAFANASPNTVAITGNVASGLAQGDTSRITCSAGTKIVITGCRLS